MTKSRALIPLPQNGLQNGGLEILEVEWMEGGDEWARRVLAHLGKSRIPFPALSLAFAAVVPQQNFLDLIQEALAQKRITRNEVLDLYWKQSIGVRVSRPILDLHDLLRLHRDGKPLFSKQEIVKLAEEAEVISVYDVELFMSDENRLAELPVELVKKWVEGTSQEGGLSTGLSMLTRARLAEYLYRKDPKTLNWEILAQNLEYAAEVAPKSGAVQILMTILYELERKRKGARRDRSREQFAGAVIRMVTPTTTRTSLAFFEAQELLRWYLSNPFFTEEDKAYVEAEVGQYTKTYGEMYRDFVKNAKGRSPFSVR